MAEISYPFAEANDTGGSQMVSQVQWQAMAGMWGGDRVDFALTSESYSGASLPFSSRVINGRTVEIQPGRAWVGGFYYQLTAAATVTIEANPTDKARKDTIVLRADVVKGSVNLAAVKGQPSASPIAPQPQRNPGQVWEMVLYEVDVPPKDGAITPSGQAPFKMPPPVSTPWNTRSASTFQQVGTFLYDLDNNGGDTQYEAFVGRDGYVVTRHFGKSRPYTPSLVNARSVPSSGVTLAGRWRWVAPGVVYFSVNISNATSKPIENTGGSAALGFKLPQTADGSTGQVFTGLLQNLDYNSNMPNFMDVQGYCFKGNGAQHVTMFVPNLSSLKEGLDTLRVIPAKSEIIFSGMYEARVFG
ncbi:hypothetical protein [Streptomyces noursei]|uniref:hypothetical protein n=1 Tax=Streptomyces noursei TaxID=1971 RepID=UPI00167307B1|nr:hypothetical protein [Streptomyces noursei]MCZ1015617.1 hypothetical protein [Streptomyces noursei]GGW89492.1 hypothetical protein GCM10010341_07900 [Streptomyces noursei]